jgi:hypothetical protein
MNMMKYCPECYKELPPNSASCPFCGYKLNTVTEEESAPLKILKTPETDSYIPPEQTTLSLILLLIFFWGINIALTVLPILLDAGTVKNLLIAGISSQLLTRIPIGLWALEEQSLKKDQTPSKKFGSFLLTFIPIGAIFSFLHAAKTMIRKERLSNLSIAAVSSALVMGLMLFITRDGIFTIISGDDPPPIITRLTSRPTQAASSGSLTGTVASPQSTVDLSGCKDPASITIEDEGKVVAVCGEITNYGDRECETCPKKYISFIRLDDSFQVMSYDWQFTFSWLGICLRVEDEVEILGDKPVFTFGKADGYIDTECSIDLVGELICEGEYFQYYDCEQ